MKPMLRERIVESGNYVEIDIYPVFKVAKSRAKRAFKSRPVQIALNHKNSARKLKWLIQENFTEDDYYVVLSYPAGFSVTVDEAKKIFKRFLRRIRNRFKRLGLEFKYIYVTEIGDKKGRPHHHLIASGNLGDEIFETEWNKPFEEFKKTKETSYVWDKKLEASETGFGGLAEYTTKDHRYAEYDEDDEESEELVFFAAKEHAYSFRSYNCSKNLRKPKIKTRDGYISFKKLNEFITDCYNRDLFEKRYPSYTFVEADPHWRDVCSAYKHLGDDYFDFPRITILMNKKTPKKEVSKAETTETDSIDFDEPELDEYGCPIDIYAYWDCGGPLPF